MKRGGLWVASVVLLALLAAGCGGGSELTVAGAGGPGSGGGGGNPDEFWPVSTVPADNAVDVDPTALPLVVTFPEAIFSGSEGGLVSWYEGDKGGVRQAIAVAVQANKEILIGYPEASGIRSLKPSTKYTVVILPGVRSLGENPKRTLSREFSFSFRTRATAGTQASVVRTSHDNAGVYGATMPVRVTFSKALADVGLDNAFVIRGGDGLPVPVDVALEGLGSVVKVSPRSPLRRGGRYAFEADTSSLVDAAGVPAEAKRLSVPFTVSWTWTFGTMADDEVVGVGSDGAGNVYAAVNSKGSLLGSANADPTGSSRDVYVVRVSADGSEAVLQGHVFTAGDDQAKAIAVTPSGTVYVAGTTTSSGPSGPRQRAFVARVSGEAEIGAQGAAWARAYLDMSWLESSGNALAVSPSGGLVYLAGHFVPGPSAGWVGFVSEIDAATGSPYTQIGNMIGMPVLPVVVRARMGLTWFGAGLGLPNGPPPAGLEDVLLTGPAAHGVTGVAVSPAGYLYVVGWGLYQHVNEGDNSVKTRYDGFVMEYSPYGFPGLLASRLEGGGYFLDPDGNDGRIYGVAANQDGDAFVVGNTVVQETFTTKLRVEKLPSLGSTAWSVTKTVDSKDYLVAVAAGSEEVYVAGKTTAALGGMAGAGDYDAFVLAFDGLTGRERTSGWPRLAGTPYPDSPTASCVDGGGNVYVAGKTAGDMVGVPSAGGYDGFVVKYDMNGVLR